MSGIFHRTANPLKLKLLLLLGTSAALSAGASPSDGHDLRRLHHPSLPHTEFHLYARKRVDSQLESEDFCRQQQLSTVSTREVRYFWKQLPYNISFYLGSRIEMTTDHPEIERGEVLCFPLRRINAPGGAAAAYDALQALQKKGGSSCRADVTSVLCKRQSPGSGNCTEPAPVPVPQTPPEQQQQKQQQQQQQAPDQQQMAFKLADGSVCMSGSLFWTLTAGTSSLLLLLAIAAVTLAVCSVRFKRQLNNSFGYRCLSRQASARLMMHSAAGKHLGGGGGSHASGAALDTEDGGGFFL